MKRIDIRNKIGISNIDVYGIGKKMGGEEDDENKTLSIKFVSCNKILQTLNFEVITSNLKKSNAVLYIDEISNYAGIQYKTINTAATEIYQNGIKKITINVGFLGISSDENVNFRALITCDGLLSETEQFQLNCTNAFVGSCKLIEPKELMSFNSINLNNEQKAQFISVILAESWGCESQFEPFCWIYFNWIHFCNGNFDEAMSNSSAYKKSPNYKMALSYLGYGDEYKKNEYFEKRAIKPLNKIKEICLKKIFISNPKSIYSEGWRGQGYYGDMNIRDNEPKWRKKWAMASQYYWLQKQCKVKNKYIIELVDRNWDGTDSTSYIYNEEKIEEYFKKYPQDLPKFKDDDYSTIPKVHPILLPPKKK